MVRPGGRYSGPSAPHRARGRRPRQHQGSLIGEPEVGARQVPPCPPDLSFGPLGRATPDGRDRISPWRNDGVWRDRLREDAAILEAQMTRAQDEAVRRIVGTKERGGELDLMVVYGSVSRGEQLTDSDLDVYYETSDLAVEFEQADPNSRSHVFGAASGDLLDSLRRGDEMAFDVVSDALVVYDGGSFRALLVAIDEERLRPAEP